MKYHIEAEDRHTIASFEHKRDRDNCLDVFLATYVDYTFYTVDDEE